MKHRPLLPALTLQQFSDRLREISPEPLSDRSLQRLHLHYEELRRWGPRLSLIGPGTHSEVLDRHYGESLAALPFLRSEDRSVVDIGSGAGFPGLVLAAVFEPDLERDRPPLGAGYPSCGPAVSGSAVAGSGVSGSATSGSAVSGSAVSGSATSRLAASSSASGSPPSERRGWEMTLVEAREKKWSFLSSVVRKASLPCFCLNARVDCPLPAGFPATVDVVVVRALRLAPPVLAALGDRLSATGRFLLWLGDEAPQLPSGLEEGASLPLPGSERRRILEIRRRGPGTPSAA